MVDDLARLQLAQQPVGAGGDAADAAVGLVAPVVEATALGEVMGLVGKTRAQAARVAFVESDDVVRAGELGDGIEAAALVARRQHVRPAARDVVVVAARARPRLDVGAQQAEPACGHGAAGGEDQPPAAVPVLARSCATRWSVMRSMSSKLLPPVTRYLPATTIVGVDSTPLRWMNCVARLSLASMAKLDMVLANCFGSTPYLA